MKSLKLTILAFSAAVFALGAHAQNARTGSWCKSDENLQEQFANNPALIQLFEQGRLDARNYVDNYNSNNAKPAPYIIPVVVHNITHDGGVGYVSKATIDAAIDRLNLDFQRLNSDTTQTRALFKPYAMSLDIEFRLAHLDPNGNCTEGIVRLEHSSSADFSDGNKGVSYWDSKKYFNIWLVDLINGSNPPSYIAGYAQFPQSGINSTYGVVVDNTFFGANDRTLTHEIGHCFGLAHTFQSGCGSNCSSSGDFICDTPPSSTATYGCSSTQNSCSNDANGPDPFNANVVDQIENYMSYDNCQNMFTLEQKATMEYHLNNTNTSQGLAQLVAGSNLTFTGTANPYNPAICAPIADFSYNKEFICEGDAVTFTDDSYNATPTGWNWTFTGGTPASSAVSNPTITYNTAGVYSVTHQPSTSAGSDMITKNSIITVSSLTAAYNSPVSDSYENTAQFTADWIVGGNDGIDWASNSAAAATGARSIRLLNYAASAGDEDVLISPSYDLTASSNKLIKFKVAYANKNSSNTDKLFVYYSVNCGASWILKTPLTNGSLTTAPNHSNSFVPTSTEWTEHTMDFTSAGTATNFRLKFHFFGEGGNNIYIDDINIGGTVGIEELSNLGSFNVYPNPTNSSAKIAFNLLENVENLSIKVLNAVGQEVTNVIDGESFSVGKYTLDIDKEKILSSGIYFVQFNADNNIKMQKLIVQ